jgi:signal transduction histidine kinase
VPMVWLDRLEPDGSRTTLARWPADAGRRRPDVVHVPIVVAGERWGRIGVALSGAAARDELERRLSDLAEPVAAAIGRIEAEDRLHRLAAEQEALGRVATLVATEPASRELLDVVAREVAVLLGLPAVTVERREADGSGSVLGSFGQHGPPAVDVAAAPIRVDGAEWGRIRVFGSARRSPSAGTEARLAGFTELVATAIAGAQARDSLRRLVDEQAALRHAATWAAEGAPSPELFRRVCDLASGLLGGAAVGVERASEAQPAEASAPIVVDGTAWGSLCARPRATPVPADAPALLGRFAEILATAISKAEARDEVHALLAEQASLRRVATLVAERADPETLFSAVTDEVSRLLRVPVVTLERSGGAGAGVVLAATRAAAGYGGGFGVPIVVDGQVWGMIRVASSTREPVPESTRARLTRFTELVAIAISNATARAALVDSRARLLVAGDEARRRIERSLRDGAEQRLLALGRKVAGLRARAGHADPELDASLAQLDRDIASVVDQLSEISRGLRPALLAGGLRPSLEALAARSRIPVDLRVDLVQRPPEPVETAVYYLVSEALTNAGKHSRASTIRVRLAGGESDVQASVIDDGVGGAEPAEGSGLAGLADRVVALGGRFDLESPPQQGTRIDVRFPLPVPG